ncbi:MAG: peptidase [Flavobacteriaceae bacterium]|nr:peptidase [Flavobacteriaceae bacterium]
MPKNISFFIFLFIFNLLFAQNNVKQFKNGLIDFQGFFNFSYSENKDRIYLEVNSLNKQFLYVSALSQGIGSNDIGLDRGQLGVRKLVFFKKTGNKLLLIEPNLKYVAKTKNTLEKKSVDEAFAKSVLHGFNIMDHKNGSYKIDITSFLLEDRHGIIKRLVDRNQGAYSIDKSKSSINLDRTKAFEKNIEFDVLLTFTGNAKGNFIKSVTPSPDNITVYQHHSFIELPDNNYKPRIFDPRSGSNSISYFDYSSPVTEKTLKQYILRHRLIKKDKNLTLSEPLEPIVYYLDNGVPEPVRSALIEGGEWWNDAFEKIGFKNAFKVKILPKNVDPLDIRYNVIQWVHRSTRGWSYGSSVIDPRTGEIIKGHVSLGSLRVRQDFMIAIGLLEAPYSLTNNKEKMALDMALSRIKQLSAHEIGHTLGFSHNFSASSNNDSSVMDYPHPNIKLSNNKINIEKAYSTGIGEWDKASVAYSYSEFDELQDEKLELNKILENSFKNNLSFISDADSRPIGSSHPSAHLWDNGSDALTELRKIIQIRDIALRNISLDHLKKGEPYSNLQDIIVPIYLLHRYQSEAVVKLIGGVDYDYAVKGNIKYEINMVEKIKQREALTNFIELLTPEKLKFPNKLKKLLFPKAFGSKVTRENFLTQTGVTFDFIGAANTLSDNLLKLLLNSERVSRLIQQSGFDVSQLSFEEVLENLFAISFKKRYSDNHYKQINEVVKHNILKNIFSLGQNPKVYSEAKAIIFSKLESLDNFLAGQEDLIYSNYYRSEIQKYFDNPDDFRPKLINRMPDGSPIGIFSCDY